MTGRPMQGANAGMRATRLRWAMIHRIEVLPRDHDGSAAGRIYLVDSPADEPNVRAAAAELLVDPVTETFAYGPPDAGPRVEIHPKPGVMDPVALSTTDTLRGLGLAVREVRTGRSYVGGADAPPANGVVEDVHHAAFVPEKFPSGRRYDFELRTVPLLGLDDDGLKKLSRDGHLFLSLEEMRAVQEHFRGEGREPTDCELETIAQTWSEHCVHKTLKANVVVKNAAGEEVRRYGNLIKETIFAATKQIMAERGDDFCLSVFVDNAGVIAFDEEDAVCFKVETHNHPSALEPYGGSATGIGGVIRDVLGTGLAARPFANTDVFCVAPPDMTDLPRGVIPPRRVLEQIVAGVRDYGNRMGIPTVNGAVFFDERYVGNPLVYCGCAGILPRDKVSKAARRGDAIVVLGGRTGRDGIHGATFSSAELTDTHAEEFSHAVQIGNPITEKKVADVVLAARDHGGGCLFTAITDCGAGGLSSAVGEMGEATGALVHLDKVPLKYAGLRYDETWISEAQERMVLAVPPNRVHDLLKLARSEDVEATVIGTFGQGDPADPRLVLEYNREEVCDLSMRFLHDGVPMPTREALGSDECGVMSDECPEPTPALITHHSLLITLAAPNTASKHWLVRQYDHEVQGGSVVKPLGGPRGVGPSDAAVVRPKLSSEKGVVLSVGLAPGVADCYAMTVAAMDEAVRNAVATGANPARLALLDNFCWPSVDTPEAMGTLVAACEACHDYALALGTPFVSGKDSLHNQFTDSETGRVTKIPPTMLISAIGVIDDVTACRTTDLKSPGNALYLLRPAADEPSLVELAAVHKAAPIVVAAAASAHDVSDGGVLAAVAEMCIASGYGAKLDGLPVAAMAEFLGGYVLELPHRLDPPPGCRLELLGEVTADPTLALDNESWPIEELTTAWRGTLDW